jgi:alkylhydroperoxidase family enzyme
MTWLRSQTEGTTPLERVLGLRPELLADFRTLHARLWDGRALDPVLLEVCRLRVAQLHGATGELQVRHEAAVDAGLTEEKVAALVDYWSSPLYSERERRALAYAEQLVLDVHGITDDQFAALADVLSPAEVVALTLALGLFDALARFRSTLALDELPGRGSLFLANSERVP